MEHGTTSLPFGQVFFEVGYPNQFARHQVTTKSAQPLVFGT